jgi:NAD+ kinase
LVKKISLFVKPGEGVPKKVLESLKGLLHKHAVQVLEGKVDKKSEALIVLGGDGTLLHVAPVAYKLGIPLLGINLGGLGFLTEFHINEMEGAIEALVKGDFEMDKRMMLSVEIDGTPDSLPVYHALNEIVITRKALGRMISFTARADKNIITTYRGDGLIVSSPTGSTAYNLSAGGPVVHPRLDAIILTPICPFALSTRPIILPSHMEVEIGFQKTHEDVNLIIDGQTDLELKEGSLVKIKKAAGSLDLIKTPCRDYFTILREKLGWAKGLGA